MTKVIIAGSREIEDFQAVVSAVRNSNFNVTEIISGGARGVDYLAIEYARQYNIPYTEYMADWELLGKSAGVIRNRTMAEQGDALIAIWDGKSRGTLNMINTMHKLKKPIFVYSQPHYD